MKNSTHHWAVRTWNNNVGRVKAVRFSNPIVFHAKFPRTVCSLLPDHLALQISEKGRPESLQRAKTNMSFTVFPGRLCSQKIFSENCFPNLSALPKNGSEMDDFLGTGMSILEAAREMEYSYKFTYKVYLQDREEWLFPSKTRDRSDCKARNQEWRRWNYDRSRQWKLFHWWTHPRRRPWAWRPWKPAHAETDTATGTWPGWESRARWWWRQRRLRTFRARVPVQSFPGKICRRRMISFERRRPKGRKEGF